MRYAYPTDPKALYAWASRLIDDLNRGEAQALPIYTDDAAAAAGGLGLRGRYVTPGGIVRERMA